MTKRGARTVALLFLLSVTIGLAGACSKDPVVVEVAPETLILNSDQGGWITVHINVPARLVDSETLILHGIHVHHTGVDSRGEIVGYFDEYAVKALVSPPSAELTLTGAYLTGEMFEGSDTVRVREK
ncbi:MAG: hypothetical protein GXY07_16870 [Candidatus Hydrogenedentes bacterium]|jgi:hypothetical protein|nr:hypothetical protein [Candidatus Hydrogenedentota bacterium]